MSMTIISPDAPCRAPGSARAMKLSQSSFGAVCVLISTDLGPRIGEEVSVDVNDHYFPGCTVPCTRLCTCNEALSKLFRCSLCSHKHRSRATHRGRSECGCQ